MFICIFFFFYSCSKLFISIIWPFKYPSDYKNIDLKTDKIVLFYTWKGRRKKQTSIVKMHAHSSCVCNPTRSFIKWYAKKAYGNIVIVGCCSCVKWFWFEMWMEYPSDEEVRWTDSPPPPAHLYECIE